MNQINLDKLLQNPLTNSGTKTGASSGELKLLVGELYTARLQMLSAANVMQVQTPQGPLAISLSAGQFQQVSQQLTQNLSQQMQVTVSPAANNQLNLSLQTLPAAASSISLSPAQLQPVLSQWLQQFPQLLSATGNSSAIINSSKPAAGLPSGQLTGQTPAQGTQQTQSQTGANQTVTAASNAADAASTLTLPMQLQPKTGQLQLAGAALSSQLLLTLTAKELAAFIQLSQPNRLTAGQAQQQSGSQQPVILTISFNKSSAGVQLSLQPAATANAPALTLTAASQQQLLQALLSQLPPVQLAIKTDAVKISVGQLSISMPPQLIAALTGSRTLNSAVNSVANQAGYSANNSLPNVAAASVSSPAHSAGSSPTTFTGNSVPLLLQLQAPATKNGQWQLLLQVATQSKELTISPNQLDRPLSWQTASLKPDIATAAAARSNPLTSNSAVSMQPLAPEVKAQAWRNLLPLLSQPLMQPNSMPNLPAPLQQFFSQIQQSLPDISKPLAGPAVAAQLHALLQFQPLQSQPNLQTAGGTLALALQLLLGHLSQKQQAPANNTPANRLNQLVSQLDAAQTGTALRQLASISSPLQQSQMATLDAQSQLQQWLLQLPLQQQGQTIMPQLLLEQREADGKSSGAQQKQWQLTMKFDLQQYGNLLAVAKLQDQDLQLQFYTDHNEALRLAQKFLPLLKDRCAAQGLTVSQAQCQLGKIPDSLLPRHNSLLTVKV